MPERPPQQQEDSERRGSHNEIGYRNVDEEHQYDERGSQGAGPGEPPADEEDEDA